MEVVSHWADVDVDLNTILKGVVVLIFDGEKIDCEQLKINLQVDEIIVRVLPNPYTRFELMDFD